MIEIEIDGKTLEAQPGETIIQVADRADIYIPRFCYHNKLSVAASCRMCLVEVEKAPKTLPACATPVTAGMKVQTRSEKALFSQKTVMEFLLINHPLDCPICDQGGECELQDLSLGYGKGISRFHEGKRAVHDEDLGPLISTEMTRCIQCSRCVRFGDEVAGVRELGLIGRGENLEIGTYVGQAVASELSGNMIDVCPVGALTSKPYRFTARAWELNQHPAIAPHDCLGSNIYIHSRGEEYTSARHVMRVVPRQNEAINEVWISNRDRFSYEALESSDRVLHPLLKESGEWKAVSWEKAISEVKSRLKQIPSNEIGALISPSATVEEHYLFQKWIRAIGSNHIDHRLRQSDFRDQETVLNLPIVPIAGLEGLDTILLIGSNIRSEQPIASQRIRKAVKKGAKVFCVNPMDYGFNFLITEKCIAAGDEFVSVLGRILKALIHLDSANKSRDVEGGKSQDVVEEKVAFPESCAKWLDSLGKPSDVETQIARSLSPLSQNESPLPLGEGQGEGDQFTPLPTKKAFICLGAYATQHPDASLIRYITDQIAKLTRTNCGTLTEGANSAGALLAGTVPYRTPAELLSKPGMNAREMFEKSLKAYVLFGVEPELDSAYPVAALKALQEAKCVISLAPFKGVEDYADIILPIATFAETSGTYVNVEGTWQSAAAAILPTEESRAGWEVLCQLGQVFGLPGFEYENSGEVIQAIKSELSQFKAEAKSAEFTIPTTKTDNKLYRLTEWPAYRTDMLVRRAKALQASMDPSIAMIQINAALAKKLNVTEGERVTAQQGTSRVTLPLKIENNMPDDQVYIPAGLSETVGFGDAIIEVELFKMN